MPDPFSKLFELLHSEWPVVQGAPWTIALIGIFLFVVAWFIQRWAYGTVLSHRDSVIGNRDSVIAERDGRIANLEERLKAKDDLLSDKLRSMPPDKAREFFQKLADVIRQNIGSSWPALTPYEVVKLSQELASVEKRSISIMHKNSLGKDLAKSLADAFESAGWQTSTAVTGDFEDGIVVGRSPTVAVQIKEAIERATPLKVTYLPPTKAWGEDTQFHPVFIGVGINTVPYPTKEL